MSAYSGTSLVTTAPAPMKQYAPRVLPQMIVAFAPIESAAADERPSIFVLQQGGVAPRIHHVREHAAGPTKDVVLELDPFIDRDVVLDLDVIPNPGPRHHDDVLPQIAALADHRPGHHMGEVPDLAILPDDRPVVDIRRFVGEIVRQWRAPLLEGKDR